MDSDEKYSLIEEARIEEEYQCSCCDKTIDGFNAIDPFIIAGMVFCLYCASDLTTLRMKGYLRQADKTKNLILNLGKA